MRACPVGAERQLPKADALRMALQVDSFLRKALALSEAVNRQDVVRRAPSATEVDLPADVRKLFMANSISK
jgi:hypothetical protein